MAQNSNSPPSRHSDRTSVYEPSQESEQTSHGAGPHDVSDTRSSEDNTTMRASDSKSAPRPHPRGRGLLPPITDVVPASRRRHGNATEPRGELSDQSSLTGGNSRVSSASSGPPFGVMFPTTIWGFNTFLGNLSKKISQKQLETLKHSFVGIIGKKYLEKIETPEQLFTKMREQAYLCENNILYLQALLRKLDRPELIQMTIDFASSAQNIMYVKPDSDTPVNGYKYIKFHVIPDKEYNLAELQQLQYVIAGILGCPAKYVLVPGIELVESVLVTLMIKEEYAKKLEAGLERKEFQRVFSAMNIDKIITERTAYTIGLQVSSRDAKDDQLLKMYEQLTNKNQQVHILESKCEQLEQECAKLHEKCTLLNANLNKKGDRVAKEKEKEKGKKKEKERERERAVTEKEDLERKIKREEEYIEKQKKKEKEEKQKKKEKEKENEKIKLSGFKFLICTSKKKIAQS